LIFSEFLAQSVSSNLIFLLAMMLYPETQQKAQDEIDLMVGRDRLPDFSDQPNLPYVNALCKEVLRWQNVAPLCEFIQVFSIIRILISLQLSHMQSLKMMSTKVSLYRRVVLSWRTHGSLSWIVEYLIR